MFRDVRIKNFRSFEDTRLTGFSKVTLITGRNGTGKTAVLEALFLNASACRPAMVLPLAAWRHEQIKSIVNDSYARNFFHGFQLTQSAEILAQWEYDEEGNKSSRNLSIRALTSTSLPFLQSGISQLVTGLEFIFSGETTSVPEGTIERIDKMQWVELPSLAPLPPTGQPLSGDAGAANNFSILPGFGSMPPTYFGVPFQSQQPGQRAFSLQFGNVDNPLLISAAVVQPKASGAADVIYKLVVEAKKRKKIDMILNLISSIEPRIKDIVPLNDRGADVIYIDIGESELRPLNIMGAGFFNALHISAAIAVGDTRIVLIDELEDGIHYLAFRDIARFIVKNSVERNIQIIITTHSDEMISAFSAVALEENFHDICVLKLNRGGRDIGVTRFADDDLIASREIELEVR